MMLSDLIPQIVCCNWRPDRGVSPKEKRCPQCEAHKPLGAFGMKGSRRQSWCKACSNQNNRLAYKKRAA